MRSYDILVIGGGGGLKIARPAAEIGYKVALIEKGPFGGTCLNRGCIPSKMMIYPAHMLHAMSQLKRINITGSSSLKIDFPSLTTRMHDEVTHDAKGIDTQYQSIENLDVYKGTAKFVSDKIVEVNGEQVSANKIIIAVGARPNVPPIEGLEGTPYVTSTEALFAKEQPKSMIVIGGGYIGIELGGAYSTLGTKVDFIVRGSSLLEREDKQIQEEFVNAFTKHNTVHFETTPKKVTYENNEFTLLCTKADGTEVEIKAEQLFMATGVKPNSDLLELKSTSIKTRKGGFIEIDEYMQTSAADVYAIGDCAGNFMFRHAVNFEGEYIMDLLKKQKEDPFFKAEPIHYPPMPHAVFSIPEIAGVGATEEELKEKGTSYVVGLNRYENSAQGMARRPECGFVKLLVDKETKKLLGAHIVGDEAATMIHMLIAYMTMNATLNDILGMIYIHPALPEIVRNAARKAQAALNN